MKHKFLNKLLLLLLCILGGASSAWATVVTYTVTSTSAVSTSGTAPTGSSVAYSQTYGTAKQATADNSFTLTLKNWEGYSISNITLSMHSNAKAGAGNLAYSTDGGTTYSYIIGSNGTGINFNDSRWNDSYTSSWVDISKDVVIDASSSDIVIKINATTKSLYCESYKITYDTTSSSSAESTTTTIDDSGITNTNKYLGTDAGAFSATVTDESDAEVDGATVTWTSSDTGVATINSSTGAVTLVAAGTTTITASYAGEDGVYKSSSDTYLLTVTNADPDIVTIWSENFATSGYDDRSTTYGYEVTGSSAVQASDNYAGGASPEMMVKSGGTFSAAITLLTSTYGYSGDLTMTFKSNAKSITVKSGTSGVTVYGEASVGAGVEFTTKDTHEVTFKGVTTSTEDITIIFSAEGGDNSRIDDIVLKGKKAELTNVATPVFDPTSGAVVSGQEVTILCATDGASIYYTTDGTDPSSSSTLYNPESKPTITATTTIKAIGIKDGLTNSSVAEASYTIAAPCATPTFSVAEGEVEKGTTVTISCATDGATIYYTTDGTIPTTSSSEYSGPITINAEKTIKAIAVKDGLANSEIASARYTLRDYANLPVDFNNGKASLPTGFTNTGLGTDYSSAPKLKFDNTGDYLILKTNAAPGELKFDIKGNNFSGGTFDVQYSADGSSYSDKVSYTSLNNSDAETKTITSFPATTRYIKWIYTNKSSGNVGLGNIHLTGCETVTVGSAGYTTYTTTGKVCFPEGVTGYIATSTTASTVELTSKESVPASTPIILKASTDTYYLPTITTSPEDVSGNLLQASDGSVNGDGSTIYALGVGKTGANEGKVGFYLVGSGVQVPAGKAYLVVGGGAKEFLTFDFDDEATSIEETLSNSTLKGENIYNLAGQRLNKMQKGINIVNGKKVLR